MSQHDHHSHPHSHSHAQPARTAIHKNWKVWVVLGLMLLGMVIYVLTLDESVRPG